MDSQARGVHCPRGGPRSEQLDHIGSVSLIGMRFPVPAFQSDLDLVVIDNNVSVRELNRQIVENGPGTLRAFFASFESPKSHASGQRFPKWGLRPPRDAQERFSGGPKLTWKYNTQDEEGSAVWLIFLCKLSVTSW